MHDESALEKLQKKIKSELAVNKRIEGHLVKYFFELSDHFPVNAAELEKAGKALNDAHGSGKLDLAA